VHAAIFPAGANWCRFCSGKPVELWLHVEVQFVVVWQLEHCEVGNPAATWFGTAPPMVAVLVYLSWWQPWQSVFAVVNV
jgi:hypothetical protein